MSSTQHATIRLNIPGLSLLVTVLVMALIGARVDAAPARQSLTADSEACHPIDVVVLIDQSDSMRSVNDQDGKRFDAAATVAEYLGNHVLWLCRDQDIQHRISVIGFGDYPVQTVGSGVDNPYSEDVAPYVTNLIVPQTDDFRNWEAELTANVRTAMDAAKSDQLGATDHYAALQAARDQLNAWKAQPLGEEPRRQSVITITDGEPCLFARGCGAVTIYNIEPDMSKLETLTDPNGAMFPWAGADNPNSVHMSLIAMSQRGGSLQDRFFDGWRRITQSHGGDVYNANALNTNLNVITTDIMGPIGGSGMEPIPCNTDVWVNPYTDNLVIIYAAGLSAQVSEDQKAIITIDTGDEQIQISGGQATSDDVPVTEYQRFNRNEYYIFQPPVPGRYNIGYTGADLNNCSTLMDIRATRKPVQAEVTIPAPGASFPAVSPPSSIVGRPFRLEVFESVGDSDERIPLVEFEDYPIDVTASVTGPGGDAKTYSFQKTADGVYESSELIQSPTVGDYEWTLRASVQTRNPNEPEIVVLEDSGRFKATEVIPFGFTISQPTTGAIVPLNSVSGPTQKPVPIPVVVELTDVNGEPVDIDTYLTDDADVFTATLRRGDEVVETVPLTRVAGSTTEFGGQLNNSAAGGVVPAGDYTIEVDAAWSTEKYNPLLHAPANDRSAVGISQYEVVPVDLRIKVPESTTVHADNWLKAFAGELRPVDFQIEVVHAVTGEILELNNVLRDLQGNFQADLVPPSGEAFAVPLTVVDNERFHQLQAAGAATNEGQDEEGDYVIKLETAGIALNDRFAWANAEVQQSFARKDTRATSPTTYRVAGGVLAVILAGLVGLLIYKVTGGPTGSIALYDLASRREIALRGLRSTPRVNTVKHRELTERGVKYLKVKRGGKDEDGQSVVLATAVGSEGENYLDGEPLTDGVNAAFLPTAEIVYHSR